MLEVAAPTTPLGRTQLRHLLTLAVLSKPFIDLLWQVDLWGADRFGLTPQRLLALLVPVLAVLLVIVSRRSLLQREWAVYGLALAAVLAALANGLQMSAGDQAVRWLSFLMLLAVAPTLVERREDAESLLLGLVAVSLIPTALCYLQLTGVIPFYYADTAALQAQTGAATDVFVTSAGTVAAGVGRASGGYEHPTGYTNYALVAMPAAYVLLQTRRIAFPAFAVFLAFTLFAIFFTYDRTAYIAAAAQLGLMTWFTRRPALRVVLLASVAVAVVLMGGTLWRIIVVTGGLADLTSFAGLFRGRGFLWALYTAAFLRGAPWQQAFGFGGVIIEDFSLARGVSLDEPHNDWLRILYTMGVVGLLLYGRLIWSLLRGGVALCRTPITQAAGFPRAVGHGILMLLVALILLSITKEPLRYTNFAWPFALFVAPALARHSGTLLIR